MVLMVSLWGPQVFCSIRTATVSPKGQRKEAISGSMLYKHFGGEGWLLMLGSVEVLRGVR